MSHSEHADPYSLALHLADGDARRVILLGDGYLVVNRALDKHERRRVREALPGGPHAEWPRPVEGRR